MITVKNKLRLTRLVVWILLIVSLFSGHAWTLVFLPFVWLTKTLLYRCPYCKLAIDGLHILNPDYCPNCKHELIT